MADKQSIQWIKYDPKNPGDLEEEHYLINLATRYLSTAAMVWAVYDAIDNMFYVETEFGKEGFRDYVSHYAVINTPGDVIS
ncbi:hypothetical protein DXC69_03865 [Paenibacillus polymyxa]|nr:hypothetical protein DXC69_03865 [Paenibacillus polymyxa]